MSTEPTPLDVICRALVAADDIGDWMDEAEAVEVITKGMGLRDDSLAARVDAHLIANAPAWLAELVGRVEVAEAETARQIAGREVEQEALHNALPALADLTERAEEADAAAYREAGLLAENRALLELLKAEAESQTPSGLRALLAEVRKERDDLAGKVERVEAVAKQVEADEGIALDVTGQHLHGTVVTVAEMIRAALAGTDEVTAAYAFRQRWLVGAEPCTAGHETGLAPSSSDFAGADTPEPQTGAERPETADGRHPLIHWAEDDAERIVVHGPFVPGGYCYDGQSVLRKLGVATPPELAALIDAEGTES